MRGGDRGRLLERIRALDPWFHDIDLGDGLRTKAGVCADEPADHPRPTWEALRPFLPDLSGRSVLDVGCNAGFYSFEARRLGAARVLGIDAQRREIAQARLVAEVLGLDVAFRRGSVYDLTVADPGVFDVVLALGLLYHCRHPVLALERLFEVTRGTLLLESAVASADETPAPRSRNIGGLDRELVPAYYLENGPDSSEAVYNWFLPTTACLSMLLHAVGYRRVTLIPLSPDRSLYVCSREGEGAGADHHRARLDVKGMVPPAAPSGALTLDLRLWNVGTAPWKASVGRETERGSVLLGVHLLDESENVLEWDYRRYRQSLSRDVAVSEYVDAPVALVAPPKPGRYFLEFDLVREFEGWFEDAGGEPLKVPLDVREGN
jgi:tRNA (mo5U34)-methyltransferase